MFGTFLVKRGQASASQVVAALERQDKQRKEIGMLAMQTGLLTGAEVLQVRDEKLATGNSFTVSAERLGLLNRKQIDELEKMRFSSGPRLGEILVEMNVLDRKTLDRELEAFEKETGKKTNSTGPAFRMP